MRVTVLFFAALRERAGRDSEALELAPGARVADALAALAQQNPQLAPVWRHIRTAVGLRFVGSEHELADGDDLALIPPVAGGAGPGGVALSETPLSLDAVVSAVLHAGAGAMVTFTGLVRDHSPATAAVKRLDYEAYGPMALRVLSEIVDEIQRELPGTRVAVHHRVGSLQVGDVAVVIAASAPHRGPAFEACRAAIERLKERVPIWKRELGDDGATWIGMGP